MNKSIGLQLLIYSLLLAGFSYLAYHLAPALARTTLITGVVGGALCLLWAVRAMAGSRGKALSILTLVPITFIMVSQTVMAWGGGTQEGAGRSVAAVITLLLILSIAMLMRIAYAGALRVGPGNPPGDINPNPTKPKDRRA